MEMNRYQNLARKTAIYPNNGKNIIYPALGLCGEAGEVAEQVKKILRDDKGELTGIRRERIIKEMGDVLWYLSQLAVEIDIPLDTVAQRNIDKLEERKTLGRLHGEGSDR